MQDLEIVDIDDEQAYNAKLSASALSEPQIRKRGMIDMLGISCAISYLRAKKFRIDTRRSVYKIPLLFEEFKITDIYYGNYRIDVITLFKEKTVKIPKIHIDMDIMPNFYFIVQIGAKIREAKMIGFIDSKNILNCSHDSKFYYPTLDMIFGLQKFMTYTRHSIPTKTLLGRHIDCMGLFLKFIDNDLSSVYKRQLIQHLMNCDSCRARFIDVMEFEKLSNNIRYYPDLIRNDTRIKTENSALDLSLNSKFSNLEESLDNVELKETEKQKEDFIEISTNENNIKKDNQSLKTVQMFDIIDKSDTKQSSKKVIDAIFNEIPKIELPSIKQIINAKNRRMLLIALGLFFVLGSFVLISFKGTSDLIEENNEIANFGAFEEEPYPDYDYPSGQAKLIPKDRNIDDFIIQQPVSNKPAYSPTITRISWEAPESLVKKGSYTKFLQLIGKNVKLNLQNDLLLVNDVPANKKVKADIRIASNGDVVSIKLSTSSGSPAIDNSVKKVINDTLTYMKPPSHGIISKPVDVTLTVELN